MAKEEGCLLIPIVEGMQWYVRGTGKRIRVMRMQEAVGMRISRIARYRFWRQSLLNKDSRDYLYLKLNTMACGHG
jgi:16S rRNA U516 pseudouridylate synthase RsuA-like enzyme